MKFSKDQQLFIDMALSGHNIFLTGKAGTGKSTIVKEVISRLKKSGKVVAAIAPTGVAANNIQGSTIHSFFSINPYGVMDYDSCNYVKSEKRNMWHIVNTIIIDEVSMVRPDILDAINWTLLKNGCDGLSSKQVIFVGDFKQLPPVIDDTTRAVLYRRYSGDTMHYANIYNKLDIKNIELTEIQRQSDPEFISALNLARDGVKSEYFRQFVHTDLNEGIVLASYNATVNKYNKAGLDAIKGEMYEFNASIEGDIKADDFNIDTKIKVKNGAKIMYLSNSKTAPLVNGSLGVFVSHDGCHYINHNGIDHPLERMRFTKKKYVLNDNEDDLELKEIGSIEQYPFRLAYALSIHKSQGLTFDQVNIDLTRPVFNKQMLYVALSRVKSPEGLRIIINR